LSFTFDLFLSSDIKTQLFKVIKRHREVITGIPA